MSNEFTPYFYAPLAAYPNVFKCAGIAAASNIAWMTAANPGVIILTGYRGDKVSRDYAEREARDQG
jgi:hypothetical protein